MAEVVTIVSATTGGIHIRHKARHPEHAQAYWTAQHGADNDLFRQYDASDVASLVIGSTVFPVRPQGTRHVRIVYDAITQNKNWSDTTGATLIHGSSWTLWMDIVYQYSVYQSSDFNAVSAYVAQFPTNLQPILAYIIPENLPPPAGSPPPTSGGGSGGGRGGGLGHSHPLHMMEFPHDRSAAGIRLFVESGLDEWIAKTKGLDERLQTATQRGVDDGADGKGKTSNTEC